MKEKLKRIICPIFLLTLLYLLLGVQVVMGVDFTLSETSEYKLSHQINVVNNTTEISTNIYIRVPLMDEKQPVYQDILGEMFSHEPLMQYKNSEEQRFALFYIASLLPGQQEIISIDYYLKNSAIAYNIDVQNFNSTDVSDVDVRFLHPEKNIEVDAPDIIAYGAKFLSVGKNNNFYTLAKKAFADVNLYMSYGERKDNETGALAALKTGVGTCQDYAALYVAVLRSMGIPAKLQTGYVYQSAIHTDAPYVNTAQGFIFLNSLAHTWVEFYLPDVGWIVADPTFTYTGNFAGMEQKLIDWDYFAKISQARRHFYFTATGDINDISYEYMGAAPTVEFEARLFLNVSYTPFKDISNHWAKNEIVYLYNHKFVSGVGNNMFAPERIVTRSELAVILYRIMGLEYSEPVDFVDVPSDVWYAPYIAAVAKNGIMVGNDKLFRPEAALSRAEMAVIICRLAGFKEYGNDFPFNDMEETVWAKGAVAALYEKGLAVGTSSDAFSPQDKLSRAEMSVFLSRILQYKK